MKMQILSIVLYNADGQTRVLRFRLGQVNIITGKSSAGKSTLIDIVEYCMGRSNFKIPEGVIRDSVAWYAVLYQIGEMQVLVAKPAPPSNTALSHNQVYLKAGTQVDIPPYSELVPNSNDEAVVEYLSRLIGISPNLNVPKSGESRLPLEATIRHASFYLFQKQTVVANEEVLFHRQSESGIAQAIKDTLPYFLGAVREDRLKLLHELREARRKLRSAERELAEVEAISGDSTSRGRALFAEAQQVGLIDATTAPQNAADIFRLLGDTLHWQPTIAPPIARDRVLRLQREFESANDELQAILHRLDEATIFASEAQGYSAEASEQQLRLQAIGIIDHQQQDQSTCPLCSSKLETQIAPALAIQRSLNDLRNSLAAVSRERPRLREHIAKLESERDGIRQRMAELQQAIAAVQQESEAALQLREANARIARVVGRISLFLETVRVTDSTSEIRSRVLAAQERVAYLESQLDPAETEDLLNSALSSISADMTLSATSLALEFQGLPYRLDLNRLTVVVDRSGRPIPMGHGLGGGENWLGCHLIAYLALHKYFIQQNRPVPSFVILDQPTQVYFPPEKYQAMEGLADELTDDDRSAVNRMFSFLFSVCEQLAPELQIIVMDHANLNTEQFQSALIEAPWRSGRALVPADWIGRTKT